MGSKELNAGSLLVNVKSVSNIVLMYLCLCLNFSIISFSVVFCSDKLVLFVRFQCPSMCTFSSVCVHFIVNLRSVCRKTEVVTQF